MKKDVEWLKNKIRSERECLALSLSKGQETMREYNFNNGKHGALVDVLTLIDQLDEPEVLSQEWIDKNVVHVRGLGDIFEAVAVESLLVQKQELPVIPKYVGEFIEEVKASGERLDYAFSILRGVYHQSKTADWVAKENRNSETFARAWLDGYEVEEEPLYYALIKGHELMTDEGIWDCRYWNLSTSDGVVFPSDRFLQGRRFLTKMSKEDWNKCGINDTNADFVNVEN